VMPLLIRGLRTKADVEAQTAKERKA